MLNKDRNKNMKRFEKQGNEEHPKEEINFGMKH